MKTIEEMRKDLVDFCQNFTWYECGNHNCPLARWCRNKNFGTPNLMTPAQIKQTYTDWEQIV